ncbi:MAG TPA: alpha-L-arabinofuranosidase C-terminal domain-containing protein [Prolixibacteraceae bacterium]|nr:alpha-L-arabinofuranosidase C-terminal domain-containing protein [Prolixibacteraceae bacterium]
MNFKSIFILATIFCLLFVMESFSQERNLTVNVNKPIAPIQPTMWGIFFEDINMAADGGIYAELVKNRSFEFFKPLMGWEILKPDTTTGVLILNRSETNPANPRYARISIGEGDDSFGLSNEGFRGMGIKKGMTYHFSVSARQAEGSTLEMRIEIVDTSGEIIGTANLAPDTKDWQKYTVSFTAGVTEPKAKLNIWFAGKGSLDLDMISLFPDDTWKNRPGGLRADLVQLLADLKPGFLRFPGGCIVEGRELETRYQWKKTVGNVDERQIIVNRWNTEFAHRLTPDYFQTFGLGFFEYFQLAEDLGSEPLPILSCGMACQFNTAEVVPMDQLDPYIQDALDLIEFANGSAETEWGKLRIKMGHPAPFNLKMIGVGNEQWGTQYIERYIVFAKAIKEKYPEIRIVSGTGPSPDGKSFEYAAAELKKLKAEIVDEHYYANPEWFLKNATRYDNYDRNNYKIFAGEYAAQSVKTCSPKNQNNWECALAEAAFMTGLERNAEVVQLCSYAPLFAHVEGWQWKPDLIWFDNLKSFGTANYYVQKLFSNNKGTQVLSILQDNKPLTGQDGLFASAAFDQKSNEIILKLVNSTDKTQTTNLLLEGANKLSSKGEITVLKSDDLNKVNSLELPTLVSPVEHELIIKGKTVKQSLAPYSFTVIRIKQN